MIILYYINNIAVLICDIIRQNPQNTIFIYLTFFAIWLYNISSLFLNNNHNFFSRIKYIERNLC